MAGCLEFWGEQGAHFHGYGIHFFCGRRETWTGVWVSFHGCPDGQARCLGARSSETESFVLSLTLREQGPDIICMTLGQGVWQEFGVRLHIMHDIGFMYEVWFWDHGYGYGEGNASWRHTTANCPP